ncbi:putative nuclease HARBI1 [Lytechinus pictus]|uniref:putative nuclease HARBI1 n=1 Tax=Lytechinus pictus TaxID=7653 RepID=UPI0030B9DC12
MPISSDKSKFHPTSPLPMTTKMALVNAMVGAALHRERVFRDRSNPFELYDDRDMFRKYRFTRDGVSFIIDYIGDELKHNTKRSNALTPALQIFVALRFYATGSVLDSSATIHGCSRSTASRVIRRVTLALCSKRDEFIKFPCTQEEVRDTQRRFFLLASFPNVVGAIDGTHVRINGVPLGAAEHLYVNRKGFYSINVQLTCNALYEITSISARWPGSTHDSRICRTSVIAQAFREGALNGLLLGDSGYGLQSWLMTPVPLPRTRGERRYNQAHSCTRVVIEQVNGQLKSKFRCLIGGGLNMIPERASDVITACACLHNISKQMKQPEVEQERVDDDADDEANDLNEEGDAMTGKQVRDDIIRSFFA